MRTTKLVGKLLSISVVAVGLVVAGLVVGLVMSPPALAIECNDEKVVGPNTCGEATDFCCVGGVSCDCNDAGCCEVEP